MPASPGELKAGRLVYRWIGVKVDRKSTGPGLPVT
jgi:hypothetical protein